MRAMGFGGTFFGRGAKPAPPPAVQAQLERDRRGATGADVGPDRIIEEGVRWLCRAQDGTRSGDDGVARHYSLVTGWSASYPETTGYIIPTLLAYADRQGDDQIRQRARRMLDWLVSIQFDNGAFQGGMINESPIRPVTFNTGQILFGLVAGQAQFGAYETPMRRAADWLVRTQDLDGCWRIYPSPFAEDGDKVFDTHVAWALLEAARLTGTQEYADAALANVAWALTHQHANGWLASCCLSIPTKPWTHTLGYALRGIVEAYLFSKDESLLAAARRTGDGLLGALQPDGLLPGRLDQYWRGAVSWVCVTGSSQIAHSWLLLYQITGEAQYLDAARRTNAWVRRTIALDGDPAMRGAVQGSFPGNGEYCQYEYPNWATKFTIDANLLERDIAAAAIRPAG